MVAICAESSPKRAAVAITEEVSWIATAHQTPNCSCDISNQPPINGKMNNAIAFRKNTRVNTTPVCSGRAPIVGDRLATAVPPQIAVPELTKRLVLRLSWIRLPVTNPITSVIITQAETRALYSTLVSISCLASRLSPINTTAICSAR